MNPRLLWAAIALIGLLTAISVRAESTSPPTASTSASEAAAAPSPDCEYVPTTALPADHPGLEFAAKIKAHELRAPGCKPQCVARVFCASEHPELKATLAQIPMATKIAQGKVINCDANPTANPLIPSCPLPDECNQAAKKEVFRVAKLVAPAATGAAYYEKGGQKFTLKYGWDRAKPEAKIPLLTFPSRSGDVSAACHVCASTITVAEQIWNYALCSAIASNSGCSNANECASARDKDPTSFSALRVTVDRVEHFTVGAGPGNKGNPSGDAQPGGQP